MSQSSEIALALYQEQFEQDEQARDMQEMLDQQAHQKELEIKQAYQKGYIKALKIHGLTINPNPPARGKFNLDRLNEAIRRLNELNKGVL